LPVLAFRRPVGDRILSNSREPLLGGGAAEAFEIRAAVFDSYDSLDTPVAWEHPKRT
jgi:hypothetical protein